MEFCINKKCLKNLILIIHCFRQSSKPSITGLFKLYSVIWKPDRNCEGHSTAQAVI